MGREQDYRDSSPMAQNDKFEKGGEEGDASGARLQGFFADGSE